MAVESNILRSVLDLPANRPGSNGGRYFTIQRANGNSANGKNDGLSGLMAVESNILRSVLDNRKAIPRRVGGCDDQDGSWPNTNYAE
jgi:hypothetical protein